MMGAPWRGAYRFVRLLRRCKLALPCLRLQLPRGHREETGGGLQLQRLSNAVSNHQVWPSFLESCHHVIEHCDDSVIMTQLQTTSNGAYHGNSTLSGQDAAW